jgi:aminoglycoside/choline kinase family phosphotransferase
MDALRNTLAEMLRERFDASLTGCDAIEAGLGSRRFYRLSLTGAASKSTPASVIARVDAPEDPALRPAGVPPEPPLEPLRSFLADHGVPVPERYAGDEERGIELLEDLGSLSLEIAANEAGEKDRQSLYREACELVPRLQSLQGSAVEIPAFGRRLDAQLIENKAWKFIHWALPCLLGRAATDGEAEAVREAFALVAETTRAAPGRLSHRDYKAANIYVRPAAAAGRRLVLIDLQGAFMAPPEYDLVCLLRDSHVPLPESEVEAHLQAIGPMLPDAPATEDLHRRFVLLTLTRVGKDCAHYIHAASERGDTRYLPLVPAALTSIKWAGERAARMDSRLQRVAELVSALPDAPPEIAIPARGSKADSSSFAQGSGHA